MQNADKNGNIIIGIYQDPMGARWKPTAQRIDFNKQVSQKEETVKVKLEELKEEQKKSEQPKRTPEDEKIQDVAVQNETTETGTAQYQELPEIRQETQPVIAQNTARQTIRQEAEQAPQGEIAPKAEEKKQTEVKQETQETADQNVPKTRVVIASQDNIDNMIDELADTSSRDFLS